MKMKTCWACSRRRPMRRLLHQGWGACCVDSEGCAAKQRRSAKRAMGRLHGNHRWAALRSRFRQEFR